MHDLEGVLLFLDDVLVGKGDFEEAKEEAEKGEERVAQPVRDEQALVSVCGQIPDGLEVYASKLVHQVQVGP